MILMCTLWKNKLSLSTARSVIGYWHDNAVCLSVCDVHRENQVLHRPPFQLQLVYWCITCI